MFMVLYVEKVKIRPKIGSEESEWGQSVIRKSKNPTKLSPNNNLEK